MKQIILCVAFSVIVSLSFSQSSGVDSIHSTKARTSELAAKIQKMHTTLLQKKYALYLNRLSKTK